MRKRKLHTAEEEFRGAWYSLLFSLIWYAGLLRMIFQNSFSSEYLFFLLAGLIPLHQGVRVIQRGLRYRRYARRVKSFAQPRQGTIVGLTRKPEIRNSGRHTRCINLLYLDVEIYDPQTGRSTRITSEPYRIPICRYLAGPKVDVYVDESGWKYVLDGFELKKRKNDPGYFDGKLGPILENDSNDSAFVRVIIFGMMVMMFLRILGVLH